MSLTAKAFPSIEGAGPMQRGMHRLSAELAIRSYLWKGLLRPSRLAAMERIRLETARLLKDLYSRKQPSVLSGFLVPVELFQAYGVLPMFTEYLAPILAATGRADSCLAQTEAQGYSRDTCSFHRATHGAASLGYLPSFDLVVPSSHLCDGQNKTLEAIANGSGAEFMLLDVPQEGDAAGREYLRAQLAQLEERLQRLTGRKAGPDHWARVFELSNQARASMARVAELRKDPSCPLYGKEGFTLSLTSWLMLGSTFLRDWYRQFEEELKQDMARKKAEKDRVPILWLLSYPYYQGHFVPEMEESMGLCAVADELSSIGFQTLDPQDPLLSLADTVLDNPLLGRLENRIANIKRLIQDYSVQGVIHFSHFGCRQGAGAVDLLAESVQDTGVPFLELHGDCIDGRQPAEGQLRTRLQGFKELLSGRTAGSARNRTGDSGVYLGIDIGSLSAKGVLIDSSQRILAAEVMPTGASSRRTLQRLKESILAGGWAERLCRCVATGYGRAAVDFADQQVTEITCHAKGMARQIPGVRTIIDIGGQDTKAIAVGSAGEVLKFVMNDKCAAGTGRFLEMMARTLEVDIDDLGALALQGTKPAKISSLCTVFAESEVVSLIAEDTPVEAIARGICRSIAGRTVSMLERVGRERQIAMSGGVAKNTGVVKELEGMLGCRLKIPENPQIIGALGAALLALESAQEESTPAAASF